MHEIERGCPAASFQVFHLRISILANQAEVSFKSDIAPILEKKCLACHSPEKKKGGYQLQTYDALLNSGKSKEAPITPGKPGTNRLAAGYFSGEVQVWDLTNQARVSRFVASP